MFWRLNEDEEGRSMSVGGERGCVVKVDVERKKTNESEPRKVQSATPRDVINVSRKVDPPIMFLYLHGGLIVPSIDESQLEGGM
jgi:hypothetical protein